MVSGSDAVPLATRPVPLIQFRKSNVPVAFASDRGPAEQVESPVLQTVEPSEFTRQHSILPVCERQLQNLSNGHDGVSPLEHSGV